MNAGNAFEPGRTRRLPMRSIRLAQNRRHTIPFKGRALPFSNNGIY